DGSGARVRVTADVPCALEHEMQDVLDERQPAVEVHADREPGVGVECLRRAGHVPVGQGTHVAPDLVVLAIDAGLELGELREYFRGLAAAEQLAAGPEAQVDAGERLHVPVVQRPGDPLAPGRGLEVADARFERQTLLAEVPDEVPGDGEIHGAHRVEIGAVGARYEDEARTQRDGRHRVSGGRVGSTYTATKPGTERIIRRCAMWRSLWISGLCRITSGSNSCAREDEPRMPIGQATAQARLPGWQGARLSQAAHRAHRRSVVDRLVSS